MRNKNILYLFNMDRCVGYFIVHGEFDLEFVPYKDNFDDMTRTLLRWVDFTTKEGINRWLSCRVIDDRRPDRSAILAMAGIKARDKWGILLENHFISVNDDYWVDSDRNSTWYTDLVERDKRE